MPSIDYDCTKTADNFEPVIPMRKSNFDRLMKEKFEMGRKEAIQEEVEWLKNIQLLDCRDLCVRRLVKERISKLLGELGK